MTQEIIDSQSTNVDAVSGATFSSDGIMQAVEDALSSARLTTGTSNSASNDVTGESQKEASNAPQSGGTESYESNQAQDPATAAANNNTQDSDSQPGNGTSSNEADTTSTKYKDGTYEGDGTGFRGGTTSVEVVVSNGRITDISTVSSDDSRRFYGRAFNVVAQEIISSQSDNVDAVSGATFSSMGIMEAVNDALSRAV